jgi:hypothetical protein
MAGFFSIEAAAGHARRVLEEQDPPEGIVDADLMTVFMVQEAQSRAVKYVARHVSAQLPANTRRHETPCPTREVLKRELGSLERARLPGFFAKMLDHLVSDEQLELPAHLYRAAFASELNGTIFHQLMGKSRFRQEVIYDLLRGSGYDVRLPNQKCGHCGIPASLMCGRCRATFYCCREHQKKAWRAHKPDCWASC